MHRRTCLPSSREYRTVRADQTRQQTQRNVHLLRGDVVHLHEANAQLPAWCVGQESLLLRGSSRVSCRSAYVRDQTMVFLTTKGLGVSSTDHFRDHVRIPTQ